MGIRDRPIAPRSPWQNAYVERLIGSIRRECLDHIIVFGEAHLRRIHRGYAAYYNVSRTHRSLNKDAPLQRAIERLGAVVSRPVLGGLHHQYCRIQYSAHTGSDGLPSARSMGALRSVRGRRDPRMRRAWVGKRSRRSPRSRARYPDRSAAFSSRRRSRRRGRGREGCPGFDGRRLSRVSARRELGRLALRSGGRPLGGNFLGSLLSRDRHQHFLLTACDLARLLCRL
jgi:hypothetical protein